jgi:hypothetical protein
MDRGHVPSTQNEVPRPVLSIMRQYFDSGPIRRELNGYKYAIKTIKPHWSKEFKQGIARALKEELMAKFNSLHNFKDEEMYKDSKYDAGYPAPRLHAKLTVETVVKSVSFGEPDNHFNKSLTPSHGMIQLLRSTAMKNNKIEAIKFVRAEYEIGLKEAKDFVDQVQALPG